MCVIHKLLSYLLFFFYILVSNKFLLVPLVVLVIIDKPSSFQNFLRFSKCIYNPFKMAYKVSKLYVCNPQNKFAYHKKQAPAELEDDATQKC